MKTPVPDGTTKGTNAAMTSVTSDGQLTSSAAMETDDMTSAVDESDSIWTTVVTTLLGGIFDPTTEGINSSSLEDEGTTQPYVTMENHCSTNHSRDWSVNQ